MADVAADLKTWSTTAASNSPADATTVGSGLADNLQEIQKVVRQDLAHKGADIASAGTCDIGAVAGYFHDITGTTTITSFGTVSAGICKRLKFEGALTLTHNASSLILPGASNISIQVGDCLDLISEGSGNWRVTNYEPAVRVAGFVLLETQTASASAVLDFTKLSADYEDYLFVIDNILSATDVVGLSMRYSTDGGSSFFSTSDYLYTKNFISSSTPTTLAGNASVSADSLSLLGGVDNATKLSGKVELNILTPCITTWRFGHVNSDGVFISAWGSGQRATSGVNAVRFLMTSGNITSGVIRMYGMRK